MDDPYNLNRFLHAQERSYARALAEIKGGLGPRLLECAAAVVALEAGPIEEVFGYPDYLKLRSSATLFGATLPPGSVFDRLIEKYYDGEPDEKTLQLVGRTTG